MAVLHRERRKSDPTGTILPEMGLCIRDGAQTEPKLIIMISNNAWFTPSIEPYFQQILLKYYARMHNSTILHSANGSNSMLIIPALFNADHHKIDIITNPDSIPLQRLAQ